MRPRLLLIAALLLGTSQRAHAQTSLPVYDVFYLSVGSAHYAKVTPAQHSSGVNGFGDLEDAIHSAETVADLLRSTGSSYGITLTSDPGRFVTRRDVLLQLDSLIAAVRRSRSVRPFIVFYFVGHGVSEPIGFNHFSIPGDFTFRGSPNSLNVSTLGDQAIYTGEVFDILERSRIPFLMLLDNCYEGQNERFQYPVLSQGATESLRGASAVIRFMNQFHEPTPVVFAAEPGKTARTVADPRDPGGQVSLGPIARRMLLAFGDSGGLHSTAVSGLTVSSLIRYLTNPRGDPGSLPAVTWSDITARDGYLFRRGTSPRGRHIERTGTGRP